MAKQRTFINVRADQDFRYVVHDTLEDAVTEARRLASVSDVGFFTFELVPQRHSGRGAVVTRDIEAGDLTWEGR